MTSHLKQIQLKYDQAEDRILFSISTQDSSLYRFWVTRRAAGLMWNVLLQLLNAEQKEKLKQAGTAPKLAQNNPQDKKTQPFAVADSAIKQPLGQEPLLLATMRAKPATAESPNIVLQLEDNQKQSMQMGGNDALILLICHMLQQCVQLAQWNLSLNIPETKSAEIVPIPVPQ